MSSHPEMDIEKGYYSLSAAADVEERELHVYLFT